MGRHRCAGMRTNAPPSRSRPLGRSVSVSRRATSLLVIGEDPATRRPLPGPLQRSGPWTLELAQRRVPPQPERAPHVPVPPYDNRVQGLLRVSIRRRFRRRIEPAQIVAITRLAVTYLLQPHRRSLHRWPRQRTAVGQLRPSWRSQLGLTRPPAAGAVADGRASSRPRTFAEQARAVSPQGLPGSRPEDRRRRPVNPQLVNASAVPGHPKAIPPRRTGGHWSYRP